MNIEKKWFKSKTIWVAVVAGVLGILEAVGVSIPPEAYKVLVALGLYTVRDAIG